MIDTVGDVLWDQSSPTIGVGVIRDREFLHRRLFAGPHAAEHSFVAATDCWVPAVVATREADKHGGPIGYVMEASGGSALQPLLMSEIGRMTSRGVEVGLAWSFPWPLNHWAPRKAGFMPLLQCSRRIQLWFGDTPKTAAAARASGSGQWYLNYLDGDTI